MHSHFRYDHDERMKITKPDLILKRAGLKAGMTFLDIGANDGFFTIEAAKILGQTGQVMAVDINQQALTALSKKLQASKLNNVQIFTSKAEDFMPKKHLADIIFYGICLHDFADPKLALLNARQLLKTSGIIYDYDWRADSLISIGPPHSIRLSKEDVTKLAQEVGLKVISAYDLDRHFYEVIIGQ